MDQETLNKHLQRLSNMEIAAVEIESGLFEFKRELKEYREEMRKIFSEGGAEIVE